MPPIHNIDLPSLPEKPNPYGVIAQFMSDSLAQAAGVNVVMASDPKHENIEIADWEDWTRLISGFKELSDWHIKAWAWAWTIRFGVYVPPFVAIAPRGGGKSSSAEQIICALGARDARKYVLYVRATQAQANSSIANIANILENSKISEYYPLMGNRMISAFGQSKGWNRTMLRTASGFTVAAFGLDSALRGSKVDDYRPDFICHEVGTNIFDPTLKTWCKVEQHPGLITFQPGPGVRVLTSACAEPEVVTPEHRYWTWTRRSKEKPPSYVHPAPQWREAKDLDSSHFIGFPIRQEEDEPQPIAVRTFGDGSESLTAYLDAHDEFQVPPEFNDPEWWWLFGVWWRRGGFADDFLYIRFRNTDNIKTPSRIVALLQRYGIAAERHVDRRSPRRIKGQEALRERDSYHLAFHHDVLFRWLRSWVQSNGVHRAPPLWVETLRRDFQKQLVTGYIDTDTYALSHGKVPVAKHQDIAALIAVKRLMARLGLPACTFLIKVRKKGEMKKPGPPEYGLQTYSDPPSALGRSVFIEDGFVWSRVRSVDPVGWATFAPITTQSHTYVTDFGLSHNCLDDLDEKHDSPIVTAKKIETLTKSILPAGSTDMTVLAIQNKILDDGIFARLADGTADFLADREMVGPVPAVEQLEYRVLNNVPQITGGTATWSGQSIDVCEQQMKMWGVRAFLAEAQHMTSMPEGGTFDGLVYTRISDGDLPELKEIVCWIDPAVSSTTRSDSQAIQIDGIEKIDNPRKRPRIFRLYSWEGIDSPSNAIKRALRIACDRGAKRIGIETNQGGDLWEDEYLTIAGDMLDAGEIDYIPTFDSAKAGAHTGSKEDRAGRMLTDYTRGYIVHVEGTHTVLEEALGRFPMIAPDDLVDACYWSWYDLRSKDKYRGKPRFVRVGRNKLFNKGAGSGNTRASHLRRLGLR